MLLNIGLSKYLWTQEIDMAHYIINNSPKASLKRKVANKVWTYNHIDLDNLRIFGCPDYVYISSEYRSKLDPKQYLCQLHKGVKEFNGEEYLVLENKIKWEIVQLPKGKRATGRKWVVNKKQTLTKKKKGESSKLVLQQRGTHIRSGLTMMRFSL